MGLGREVVLAAPAQHETGLSQLEELAGEMGHPEEHRSPSKPYGTGQQYQVPPSGKCLQKVGRECLYRQTKSLKTAS